MSYGIFCKSRAASLRLAPEIMVFVGRGTDVDPTEAWELKELRGALKNKFCKIERQLGKSALSCD